jgi:hypothetical protein
VLLFGQTTKDEDSDCGKDIVKRAEYETQRRIRNADEKRYASHLSLRKGMNLSGRREGKFAPDVGEKGLATKPVCRAIAAGLRKLSPPILAW